MKNLVSVTLLLVIVLMFGCSGKETPNEAVEQMINMYSKRDFDTLVKERYAELYKAKNQSDIDSIVTSLENRFADPAKLEQVLLVLESAKGITPVISSHDDPHETQAGKVAVFQLEKGTMKLVLLKTEKWGFTL